MTALITLLSVLLCLIILYAGFYLAKYVVERQHRVHVLEDSYKEAVEQIQGLQQTIIDKDHEIEQMKYESQLNGERVDRPRAWNPRDPLNSEARQ